MGQVTCRVLGFMLDGELVKGRSFPVWRGRPMGGRRGMKAAVQAALPDTRWCRPGVWRGWFCSVFDDCSDLGRADRPELELWLSVDPSGAQSSVSVWCVGDDAAIDEFARSFGASTGFGIISDFRADTLPSAARLGNRATPSDAECRDWLAR